MRTLRLLSILAVLFFPSSQVLYGNGLEIHQTGTSRQIEMRKLDVRSTVIYNYMILPVRSGKFKIPPQTIHAAGTSLRTLT